MNRSIDTLIATTIPLLILIHLLAAPFTKVEESFNIQAIHDVQTFGLPGYPPNPRVIAEYDHVEFPGSVPRTFVGAIGVAYLSKPLNAWVTDPLGRQLAARGVLGLLNAAALLAFRRTLYRQYGQSVANWYTLLQASQFHVIFYASRTLPNMYAFILTTLALRSYIVAIHSGSALDISKRHHTVSLVLLTISGIVFRAEIAVLLAMQTVYTFFTSRYNLSITILKAGIVGLVLGLAATIPIDSILWHNFPTWPEWSSFYYNTIQGQASNWGVSPFYWYFTSALPRLLLTSLPLIPFALFNPVLRSRAIPLLIPSTAFITLYSLLPHKEWRFILYTVPPLTAVSALPAAWLWSRRNKNAIYRLLSFLLIAALAANTLLSTASLYISSLNYPGGVAIQRLASSLQAATTEEIREASPLPATLNVHADNLACQTGLTRFLSSWAGAAPTSREKLARGIAPLGPRLVIDKTDDPRKLLDPLFWDGFDYALAEKPELAIGAWEVVDVVRGFAGVGVVRPGEAGLGERGYRDVPFGRVLASVEAVGRKLTGGWWIGIRMEPRISILRRQRGIGGHEPIHEAV